jgi:tetratricopeptide (TPR) repeat protein
MGDGTFRDIAFEANVYDGGWCWAGRFWDYDNDGDLDIMVANGYISGDPDDEYFTKLATSVTQVGFDPIDAQNWPEMGDSTFSGYQTSRVWRNEGNEVFTEVGAEIGLADIGDGRGLAIADFDNDGDLDVYIANQGQDSAFYRNDMGQRSHWLEVDLTGTNCNRDAIGTRVTVAAEGLTQIREVDGGNGNHSQVPHRLHFGLGQRETIESVEIRWPTGYVQRFEDVRPNRIIHFTESTPPDVLEERRIIREAEIAALQAERQSAKAEAQRATEEDSQPVDWRNLVQYKRQYLDYIKRIEQAPDDPRLRHDFAMLLDKQNRKRAALAELERAVELDPDALLYSNAYRALIRGYGHEYYDRSIRFFETLVEKHPAKVMPRLNKALAYVDKMPYPKLGIVSQGKLSNQSIAELDMILREIDRECWTAKFIRAMNHLHWPRKLNHAPLAIRDFTELIEMQKRLPPEKQRDYFALGYVGLGDSYVKNREEGLEENLDRAHQAWTQGVVEYPDSQELKRRLELFGKSDDRQELIDYVRELRGLEDPVDTDLSRVWVE